MASLTRAGAPKTKKPKTAAPKPKTKKPKVAAPKPKTKKPKVAAPKPKTKKPKVAAPKTKTKKPTAAARQARAAAGGLGAGLVDLRRSTEPPPKPPERRSVGLRGAAPWVARHAAKHAAELRARNAEPAPPGSARATLRTPAEAEQIKARIAQLHQQTTRIRSLCRRLDRHFYEVGQLLADIQQQELHLAKGYSSFEAFLDRELDIGRAQALRLVRIAHTFLREMAYDYGLERLVQALAALDGELAAASPSQPSNRSFSSPGLPARPPIRFGD